MISELIQQLQYKLLLEYVFNHATQVLKQRSPTILFVEEDDRQYIMLLMKMIMRLLQKDQEGM